MTVFSHIIIIIYFRLLLRLCYWWCHIQGAIIICEPGLSSYLHCYMSQQKWFCQWPLYISTNQHGCNVTEVYYIWTTPTYATSLLSRIVLHKYLVLTHTEVFKHVKANAYCTQPLPAQGKLCKAENNKQLQQGRVYYKQVLYIQHIYVITSVIKPNNHVCMCVCSPHVNL